MTDYALLELNFYISPLLTAAGLIAFAVPSSLGQTGAATTPASPLPTDAAYVATMSFDVASVRESGYERRLHDECTVRGAYDDVSCN